MFARKICKKNYQNARIVHDFCPKNAEFYIIIGRKIFFPIFFLGGGARAIRDPLPSVSYAYDRVCTENTWGKFCISSYEIGLNNYCQF